jgi:16S rRNA (adenine1518-N6/adenine1519-N6)-dimethyltransferase
LSRNLGQHFLIRDSILERIATSACGDYTPRVIEIGPGRGALTRFLLPRTDELHVIELDSTFIRQLERKFAGETKLHIHQADVLATDLTEWGPAVIAGNLPYYITSPIIENFISLDQSFPLAVFLIQLEVAERLVAEPASRAYGYLTVTTRLICDVQLIVKVPPSAFVPPPKVDSAAVQLIRKKDAAPVTASLIRFIKLCFAHKRKTLRNNLRPLYGAQVDSLPEAPLRAEQLTVAQFVSLHSRLSGAHSSP